MADNDDESKTQNVHSSRDMHLKEEADDAEEVPMDTIPSAADATTKRQQRSASTSGGHTPHGIKTQSQSPVKASSKAESPALKTESEETLGGEVTLKIEPGKPPKLSRTTSHKVERRPPPLFWDHDDRTAEATSMFSILTQCVYANKHLGTTEHALECDCAEEWDSNTRTNYACGEDSDCINRATKMECVGDCGCGVGCQNQRFQQKQYADVTVFKTDKKGYGLRVNTDLKPNDFIFEYIGEVIGEAVFRRRMKQYDEEGIKHFYFMSLTKGEFVDATKRGNMGRFCNHSCNPNCYVDKWVVGDKLRMGIFAERNIQAGEELTFNYNVDRYGADPQPCYCAEPNCTGFIGGKTQTERGTKLSNAVIEALGIDDADAWDTAVAKRPRKKKTGEDDEEYVNNVEPRGLDEEGVNKVMSTLMQCKEKWITVKLLARIQRADDERVRNRVVRFHGYRIMKTVLSNFSDDVNVCLQVLDVLDKMPRLTRNKIQDSKIEEAVGPLRENEDSRVAAQAGTLLDAWSRLEMAYRIPRMKRDPNASAPDRKLERNDRPERRRSRSRSRSPERVNAPTGPRGNASSRPNFPRPPPRSRPPPPTGPLPAGWYQAAAANGSTYYWNDAGTTTWVRPTAAATAAPPPPPPKAVSDQQMLQDLIKNIVSAKKEQPKAASSTATPVETPRKEKKEDRWKSYPLDKQKKMYESSIQPHIMHVVGKYKHKLPKDDLKKWAKELAKKMVDSDFKKGRVENPTHISDKQAKGIKKHAQEFFEKAAKKRAEAEKRKAEKASKNDDVSQTPGGSPAPEVGSPDLKEDVDVDMSDNGEPEVTPAESTSSSSALKRRISELANGEDDQEAILKRLRTENAVLPPPAPPPPPPPPPAGESMSTETEEDGSTPTGEAASAEELTQTATPPTTGSPDIDEAEKAKLRERVAEVVVERANE